MKVKGTKGITLIALVLIIIAVIAIIAIFLANKGEKDNRVSSNSKSSEVQKEEYAKPLEDGSKINTSEELNKTKKLDNLEISDIQFREAGGITTLLADVTNTGKTDENEKRIIIEVIDKAGKTITTLKGRIDAVPAGGKTQINIGVTADVANAYDFRIKNR